MSLQFTWSVTWIFARQDRALSLSPSFQKAVRDRSASIRMSTKASASYACLEIRYAQQLLLRSCSFLRSRHHLPPPLLLNSKEVHFQRCYISISIMTTSKAFCLTICSSAALQRRQRGLLFTLWWQNLPATWQETSSIRVWSLIFCWMSLRGQS